MEIVQRSHHTYVERYALLFAWNDTPKAGFSFPCTKEGIVESGLPLPAQDNLKKCLSGEYAVTPQGVVDCSYTYFQASIGRCECGEIIELADFTNTCECGREYNSSGQLLAPRSQWEEPWYAG